MKEHVRESAPAEQLAHRGNRISAWYFGGAGPRVAGQALRQRVVRTAVMVAIVLASLWVCVLLGGPWWSPAALQEHMNMAWAAQDRWSALLRVVGVISMQTAATVWGIKTFANLIGLSIVVPRYVRWMRQSHAR